MTPEQIDALKKKVDEIRSLENRIGLLETHILRLNSAGEGKAHYMRIYDATGSSNDVNFSDPVLLAMITTYFEDSLSQAKFKLETLE